MKMKVFVLRQLFAGEQVIKQHLMKIDKMLLN
jgi:hypothetical protein